MTEIYVVIKEYDDTLAKRQPWYSVKKLCDDLRKYGRNPVVISDILDVPANFKGKVIKVWGITDLIPRKYHFNLIYLVTFPMYPFRHFNGKSIKKIFQNWSNTKRIFFLSLLPSFFLKNSLCRADNVITISDRSHSYLSSFVSNKIYYPYQFGNWGEVALNVNENKNFNNKTIGYFGPPFTSRCFDEVVDFSKWITQKNSTIKTKLITRIERDELLGIQNKYLGNIANDEQVTVVSGFLSREELLKELLEIDVLILPFRFVFSELPIVVLEALELGIPVVTTEDCGVGELIKDTRGVLMINALDVQNYQKVYDFILSALPVEFEKIKDRMSSNTAIQSII